MANNKQSNCDEALGICGLDGDDYVYNNSNNKKVEIYIFTDPLCPSCWGIEPKLKKLMIEYGSLLKIRYFTIPETTECRLKEQNQRNLVNLWERTSTCTGMCCDGDIWYENPVKQTSAPALAVKAAELQGHQQGIRFLRRLREAFFLWKEDICAEPILNACAKSANLDLHEFQKDLHSEIALKALRYDLKTRMEMGVEDAPTLIFFNDCIEDAGLKISGLHDFHIYVDVLTEMLGYRPHPSHKMEIAAFVQKYKFVATKEVAEVYDLTIKEAASQLKELQLQQKAECVPVKNGLFWRSLPT